MRQSNLFAQSARVSGRRIRNLAWPFALGAVLSLLACSETSLNVAPIIDLSHANSAKPSLDRSAAGAAGTADGMYTAQKGDTLYHVATMFHSEARDLARWNGLDESAAIQVGQRLRIRDPEATAAAAPPEAGGAKTSESDAGMPVEPEVRAVPLAVVPAAESHALENAPLGTTQSAEAPMGAGSSSIAATAPPSVTAVATANSGGSWIWPVAGKVLVNFDPVHGKGIDISVAEDAQVAAVANGEVSYTGSPLDYGNLVILTHANGLRTVYAHNKTILAKQGQTVGQGQIIATAGKTGVSAPLLHFEVRLKGVPVNPLDYLPAR